MRTCEGALLYLVPAGGQAGAARSACGWAQISRIGDRKHSAGSCRPRYGAAENAGMSRTTKHGSARFSSERRWPRGLRDIHSDRKTRERESDASRFVAMHCGSHFLHGQLRFFRSRGRVGELPTWTTGAVCGARSRTPRAGNSVSADACVVLRAIAAVAGAPAPTVSKASLRTPACSGAQAQLRHAWNAQLIGRGRALDGRRSRARGGADRRLCRALGTLVRAARDHQLAHPVGALIARAGAAGTWRGAHARRLHRYARVLQYLVLASAQRGRLLAAGLDRRTAADAVHLRARIRRQAHGVRLVRAAREQTQGAQRGTARGAPA